MLYLRWLAVSSLFLADSALIFKIYIRPSHAVKITDIYKIKNKIYLHLSLFLVDANSL